jgi:hypothetical protein
MKKTLHTIQDSGAKVAIIRDTPRFAHDIPICLSRAAWTGAPLSKCDAPRLQVLDQTLFATDQEAAKDFTQVRFVDFSNILCQADTCPAIMNGHTAYKDSHHLAMRTVLDLTERLYKELGGILKTGSSEKYTGIAKSGEL